MCQFQWFPQLYVDFCVLVYCDFDVCSSYVFILFILNFFLYFYFSRATVSAVLQPSRTCHMLFVLLARCVLYVFLANKWWWWYWWWWWRWWIRGHYWRKRRDLSTRRRYFVIFYDSSVKSSRGSLRGMTGADRRPRMSVAAADDSTDCKEADTRTEPRRLIPFHCSPSARQERITRKIGETPIDISDTSKQR